MPESRTRWWALGALAVAMLTIGLDTTVLNVAVPTLATDLSASTDQLQFHGMDKMLVASAGLAGLGALLAVALLPKRTRRVAPERESAHELVS